MSNKIDPSIFKAYDIRGIYPDTLDEELIEKIGAAFANLIQQETGKTDINLVVTSDMRLSSPQLKKAAIKGITSTGANVVDAGLASTPTFYFASGHLDVDGGMQVSASHNPSEWNGCKLVRKKGVPVSGDTGIMDIRDNVIEGNIKTADKPGSVTVKKDIIKEVVKEQLKDIDLSRIKPLTVVADAANAMGAIDIEAFFEQIDAKLIPINFELDGSFPSHEADPFKEENIELVKQKVKEHKADFGIATDGDGDRYFIIMDNGELLAPEILRGILAQMTLEKHPGAKIGFDIRPGKITEDMIVEAGGKPFITRVGHSLIKEQMIKADSPFSGESSGHFFYKTPQGSFESPMIMMAEFMAWLSEQGKKLSEIAKPLNRYFHSTEINSEVDDKQAVFDKLKEKYSDADKFSDLDGVYFEYPEYWFNVRASNTEPKMRLNLEARSKEVMEQKRDEVLAIIRG